MVREVSEIPTGTLNPSRVETADRYRQDGHSTDSVHVFTAVTVPSSAKGRPSSSFRSTSSATCLNPKFLLLLYHTLPLGPTRFPSFRVW